MCLLSNVLRKTNHFVSLVTAQLWEFQTMRTSSTRWTHRQIPTSSWPGKQMAKPPPRPRHLLWGQRKPAGIVHECPGFGWAAPHDWLLYQVWVGNPWKQILWRESSGYIECYRLQLTWQQFMSLDGFWKNSLPPHWPRRSLTSLESRDIMMPNSQFVGESDMSHSWQVTAGAYSVQF